MFSPLLNILTQYAGAALFGVVVGFIFKAYFASQLHNKIREYQGDILKSHARILELEAKNDQLEKRLKQKDVVFSKSKLFMN